MSYMTIKYVPGEFGWITSLTTIKRYRPKSEIIGLHKQELILGDVDNCYERKGLFYTFKNWEFVR